MFWLTFEKNWKSVKPTLIRILGFLLIFLLIYFLGFKESISGVPFNPVSGGLNSSLKLLSQNRFDFLFYPIATLGSMLVPESFVPHGWEITSFTQYLFKIFLPIFSSFLVITILLGNSIKNLHSKFLRLTSLIGVVWTILVAIIYRFNLATFSSAQSVSFLLIGGLLCTITLTIIVTLKNNSFVIGEGFDSWGSCPRTLLMMVLLLGAFVAQTKFRKFPNIPKFAMEHLDTKLHTKVALPSFYDIFS